MHRASKGRPQQIHRTTAQQHLCLKRWPKVPNLLVVRLNIYRFWLVLYPTEKNVAGCCDRLTVANVSGCSLILLIPCNALVRKSGRKTHLGFYMLRVRFKEHALVLFAQLSLCPPGLGKWSNTLPGPASQLVQEV